MRQNCWEIKKCGRQTGGDKSTELGVCPASVEIRTNGLNGGINGGRACWAIAGTMCDNEVQGTFAMKMGDCAVCEFYKSVLKTEDAEYSSAKVILEKLSMPA